MRLIFQRYDIVSSGVELCCIVPFSSSIWRADCAHSAHQNRVIGEKHIGTNARKVSDLLTLTAQHRELWNEVYRRPELSRIFATAADLVANPVSVAEERFLNEVIVHFNTGWHLARRKSLFSHSRQHQGSLLPTRNPRSNTRRAP